MKTTLIQIIHFCVCVFSFKRQLKSLINFFLSKELYKIFVVFISGLCFRLFCQCISIIKKYFLYFTSLKYITFSDSYLPIQCDFLFSLQCLYTTLALFHWVYSEAMEAVVLLVILTTLANPMLESTRHLHMLF